MMLLTAIVILVGFIALAGMVSRVSLLAEQAGREQDRPLLREVEPLKKGLDAALDNRTSAQGGQGLGARGAYTTPTANESAVKGVLEHLRQLGAARGFIARWTIDCDSGNVDKGYVQFTLSDGELQVTLRSSGYFKRPSCDTLSG